MLTTTAEGGEPQFDLEHPTSKLSDLVVPDEVRAQIREIIDAGRVRLRVLDMWKLRRAVGSGIGLTVLLSGKPGTGKTITTEIIASELELPLARVDGSKVVSKWVGETQKNLKTVLADAVLHGAVLFFDEADALFAKRVAKVESANDRFANLETNYLLQALERHDGIVVLATNIDTAIDDAFKRRLLYKVELPMPTPEERALIWERILRRSEVPIEGAIDYAKLGKGYNLAGGHIKNAILRACYRAAATGVQLTHELFDAAARAELDATGALVIGHRGL
jgi:SpoVK/Ycf46/Vps4 family AAA+-type ATPase